MNDRITEEAWQWHCSLARDDADWDGFTTWLEADPAHREAYDAIASIDADLDDQRDRLNVIVPSVDQGTRPAARRWGAWAGGAVAAALALFVALPMTDKNNPATVDYTTKAGQNREIALEDGSRITLGPSSHLRISGEHQQDMALQGGALFDIRHDPGRALTITAGGQQISDIGTRFDVLSVPDHVRIAVAEGRVAVRPTGEGAQSVEVVAGRSLAIDTSARAAQLRPVSATDVGSWRTGRLVYDDMPLSLVAADLSRYVGREVIVAPDVARRRFSGVLTAGDGVKLVDNLGEVMGLEARDEGSSLRLVAKR